MKKQAKELNKTFELLRTEDALLSVKMNGFKG
jgi:hypothetical protein